MTAVVVPLPPDSAELKALLPRIPKDLLEPLIILMSAMQCGVLSTKQVQESIASGKGPADIVGALTVEQYLTCCRERAERRQVN